MFIKLCAFMSVFLIFYYSIFSLFCFFLSLYCIYYVYCYGRPALMDVCLHWQPANILIVVYLFNLFIWLLNSLSLSRTIGPATAASEHTTAPINHTRPSPRKHSPDGASKADIRLQLPTHLSTPKG